MLTMTIGVSGIALSLPIGILLALGRRSDLLVLKAICVCFIEFMRGVPLITLLFVASTLLNYFLPPGTYFRPLAPGADHGGAVSPRPTSPSACAAAWRRSPRASSRPPRRWVSAIGR